MTPTTADLKPMPDELYNAFADAIDLADNIISINVGNDTPKEWHKAVQRVAEARQISRADQLDGGGDAAAIVEYLENQLENLGFEINPSNYDHDDVERLNNTAIESYQIIEETIRRIKALRQPAKVDVAAMVAAYEEEREKYRGGVVYYPNNQAAFEGAMQKALAATGRLNAGDADYIKSSKPGAPLIRRTKDADGNEVMIVAAWMWDKMNEPDDLSWLDDMKQTCCKDRPVACRASIHATLDAVKERLISMGKGE